MISYLAIGEEAAALIDTGYGMGDIKGLAEELTDLPLIVITTHTHVDHIWQNHRFERVAVYDHPFARENADMGRGHESVKGALDEGMVWKPPPSPGQSLPRGGILESGGRGGSVVPAV